MLLKAMTIIIVLFGNIFKRITQYSLVAVVVQKKVAQKFNDKFNKGNLFM